MSVSVIKPISLILAFSTENKLAIIFKSSPCQAKVPPREVACHRMKSMGKEIHLSHLCEMG